MLAIEHQRWMVTLGGLLGEHVPTDDAGYLSFAESLPCPDLYDVIRSATPSSDVACFAFSDSRWHHYERLRRFPESYAVLGDALCSFNPFYGQGMSVAALEALALRDCLSEPEGMRHLWPRLLPRLSHIVDGAWQLAVGGDMAYPELAGPRRHHVRAAMQWYLGKVHKAAASDEVVCRTFFDVANLLAPPRALVHPRLGVRVLHHVLTDGIRRLASS